MRKYRSHTPKKKLFAKVVMKEQGQKLIDLRHISEDMERMIFLVN